MLERGGGNYFWISNPIAPGKKYTVGFIKDKN